LYHPSELLIGEAATLDQVLTAAAGSPILHLATHGLFRAGAPQQSGVRLADGWLTGNRAAALRIEGAEVVLSACDTGRSIVAAGDEILGLARGFFLAGARAVVMSLWPARDDASLTLMQELHRHRSSGVPLAAALREAQLAARQSHPHPWWWAPFVVSGYAF
jgi:CHAT domain-containing protein